MKRWPTSPVGTPDFPHHDVDGDGLWHSREENADRVAKYNAWRFQMEARISTNAGTSWQDHQQDASFPPMSWTVEGLVPAGGATGLFLGAEKNGKSLSAMQMCFAVGLGIPFLGHETKKGHALLIEYEGSGAAFYERLQRQSLALNGAEADVHLIHRPTWYLDGPEGDEWLMRVCEGMDLTILGPASKGMRIAEEASPVAWEEMSKRMQRVVDRTGSAIALVHHTRKPDKVYGPPHHAADFFNSVRGSNAMLGAVDFMLGIQRDPEKTEGLFFTVQRDGDTFRQPFDFDPQTLCIWPSDRALLAPSQEDMVSECRDAIENTPGITKGELAEKLERSMPTVERYIAAIARELRIEHEGGKNHYYLIP